MSRTSTGKRQEEAMDDKTKTTLYRFCVLTGWDDGVPDPIEQGEAAYFQILHILAGTFNFDEDDESSWRYLTERRPSEVNVPPDMR